MSEKNIDELTSEFEIRLTNELRRKKIHLENLLKAGIRNDEIRTKSQFQIFLYDEFPLSNYVQDFELIKSKLIENEQKSKELKNITNTIYKMKGEYEFKTKELEYKNHELSQLKEQKIFVLNSFENEVGRERMNEKALSLKIENNQTECNTIDTKIVKTKLEIENMKKNHKANMQLVKKVEASYDISSLIKKIDKLSYEADLKREDQILKMKEADDIIDSLHRRNDLLEKEKSLYDDISALKSSGMKF